MMTSLYDGDTFISKIPSSAGEHVMPDMHIEKSQTECPCCLRPYDDSQEFGDWVHWK